jgi:hypothetical protein
MSRVTAVLTRTGRAAAGMTLAALVARVGLPALGALVFLAVLAAGVGCWVVGDDARAVRVSRVLLAWRGNPGCLNADIGVAAQDPQGLVQVSVPAQPVGGGYNPGPSRTSAGGPSDAEQADSADDL